MITTRAPDGANKLALITFVQIRDFNADSAERLAWIETRTFSNVTSKKKKKPTDIKR